MTIKRYAGDKFTGLSSDTKPTAVPDGATFYETDTLKQYLLVSAAWSEVSASAGGSVNVAAQYTWTNTQTFSNTITFSGNTSANNANTINDFTVGRNLAVTGNVTVTANVTSNYANTTLDMAVGRNLTVAGNTTITGNVTSNYANVTYDLNVGQNLTVSGNLTILGSSTSLQGNTIAFTDNMYYLNNGILATITAISSNGTYVTFTATNNFSPGWDVFVSGVTPSSYNGNYLNIYAANATHFVVANTNTDAYTSGGSARGKSDQNPDLGFAGSYNDGSYHHTGFFRDASDGFWKVFDNYQPEPDAAINIDTANLTFHIADFWANTIRIGDTTTYSTVNSTAFTGSANNTTYVNGKTEVNLNVNNALTANNTTYVNTKTEGNLNVNNALTANAATYLNGKTEGNLNANSALNANNTDFFDGQDSAYFLNASNLGAGTLPDARLSSAVVNTSADFTIAGVHTYNANIVISTTAGISANNSYGTSGQVLTSNGTTVYWTTPAAGGGSVNVNATYAWTNTHSFSNTVTFTGNVIIDGGPATYSGVLGMLRTGSFVF